jgi:hypothetical protein
MVRGKGSRAWFGYRPRLPRKVPSQKGNCPNRAVYTRLVYFVLGPRVQALKM